MITTTTYDPADRLRSFDAVAQVAGLAGRMAPAA